MSNQTTGSIVFCGSSGRFKKEGRSEKCDASKESEIGNQNTTSGVKMAASARIKALEDQNARLRQLLKRSRGVLMTCLNESPHDLVKPERVNMIVRLINDIDLSGTDRGQTSQPRS